MLWFIRIILLLFVFGFVMWIINRKNEKREVEREKLEGTVSLTIQRLLEWEAKAKEKFGSMGEEDLESTSSVEQVPFIDAFLAGVNFNEEELKEFLDYTINRGLKLESGSYSNELEEDDILFMKSFYFPIILEPAFDYMRQNKKFRDFADILAERIKKIEQD